MRRWSALPLTLAGLAPKLARKKSRTRITSSVVSNLFNLKDSEHTRLTWFQILPLTSCLSTLPSAYINTTIWPSSGSSLAREPSNCADPSKTCISLPSRLPVLRATEGPKKERRNSVKDPVSSSSIWIRCSWRSSPWRIGASSTSRCTSIVFFLGDYRRLT